MLIGILSDSHGRYEAVRKAVTLFDELGVQHIIHCGDVGGVEVFDELVGHACTFVWGNTDARENGTLSYLQSVGLSVPDKTPTLLTLDGKRFAVFHGHERGFHSAAIDLEVDYILHGHTHVARDERVNGKRMINPGAFVRANPKTVATLDTATEELTFHRLSHL